MWCQVSCSSIGWLRGLRGFMASALHVLADLPDGIELWVGPAKIRLKTIRPRARMMTWAMRTLDVASGQRRTASATVASRLSVEGMTRIPKSFLRFHYLPKTGKNRLHPFACFCLLQPTARHRLCAQRQCSAVSAGESGGLSHASMKGILKNGRPFSKCYTKK